MKSLKGLLLLVLTTGLASCSSTHTADGPTAGWQSHVKPTKLDEKAVVLSETIYVPTYPFIYDENENRNVLLTVTLSMRNTDVKEPIILKFVSYYSTDGKLIKEYLEQPVLLGPMSTAEFVLHRTDVSGGSGANFLIGWSAYKAVSEPIAESVMIGTGAAESLAFTSRGVVIASEKSLSKTNGKTTKQELPSKTNETATKQELSSKTNETATKQELSSKTNEKPTKQELPPTTNEKSPKHELSPSAVHSAHRK